MIEFLAFAALLTAASLVFVLLPLWRAGRPTDGKRRDANITIYHQRYAEIEREVAAGRLNRREAEEEKDTLGARLLADIDDPPTLAGQTTVRRRPWVATLLVVLLLTGGAGGAYWQLGNWQAIEASQMPALGTMVAELEQRVADNPDDLQARAMLARTQQATGDYAAAAENYRRINATLPESQAPLVAAEAQATLQATDDLQGRVTTLYTKLLELDPDSTQALWYLGLAAAERSDTAKATAYWDRLLDQDLPDDFRNMVRNRRSELAGDKPGLGNG